MDILYFSATWCGPCKVFKPLLREVIQDYPNLHLKEIDIDTNLKTSMKYKITSVPTIVAVKDGIEMGRQVGALNEENLRAQLATAESNAS